MSVLSTNHVSDGRSQVVPTQHWVLLGPVHPPTHSRWQQSAIAGP